MSALLELAERCEAATVEQQREMLWQSWQLLRGSTFAPTDADTTTVMADGAYAAFVMKLDAAAYVDAALTLVPEEHSENWMAGFVIGNRAVCTIDFDHQREAATVALAICAAALRARAAQ